MEICGEIIQGIKEVDYRGNVLVYKIITPGRTSGIYKISDFAFCCCASFTSCFFDVTRKFIFINDALHNVAC